MESNNDLLQRIHQEYPKMSKGQKQIAAYILESYDKAAFITASKMGQNVGVSESTVVRFAYAMGYEGYPELQKSLQELIRNKLTSVQRMALSADILEEDVLRSVLKADIANLRATIELIDQEGFHRVIDRLRAARRVYVVGMRSSAALAQFLVYYLGFVLADVRQVGDGPGDVFERMIGIQKGDVVIGISFPRYSSDAVEALHFAREEGAFTIALTDGMISPLVGVADECLIARSDMASFADSLVAPLSLINAIIFAVGQSDADAAAKRFERLESIWNSRGVYVGDRKNSDN